MLWILFSCLLTMEVGEKSTSIVVENTGLPSCNQKIEVGQDSSVHIGFTTVDGHGGWGSGNYFKFGKYKFIITAAHVIDEGELFALDGEEQIPLQIIYNNRQRDIAIVIPLRDISVEPRKLKINDWPNIEGQMVNYTGYPSDVGKSTYSGHVSKSDHKTLIIQSFALPGSSGSVVFDQKGRAVGVVSAVKVAQSPVSPFPELVETLVFVERFSFIDKKFLKEVFMSADRGR